VRRDAWTEEVDGSACDGVTIGGGTIDLGETDRILVVDGLRDASERHDDLVVGGVTEDDHRFCGCVVPCGIWLLAVVVGRDGVVR
jgi:hypothetical protein